MCFDELFYFYFIYRQKLVEAKRIEREQEGQVGSKLFKQDINYLW